MATVRHKEIARVCGRNPGGGRRSWRRLVIAGLLLVIGAGPGHAARAMPADPAGGDIVGGTEAECGAPGEFSLFAKPSALAAWIDAKMATGLPGELVVNSDYRATGAGGLTATGRAALTVVGAQMTTRVFLPSALNSDAGGGRATFGQARNEGPKQRGDDKR